MRFKNTTPNTAVAPLSLPEGMSLSLSLSYSITLLFSPFSSLSSLASGLLKKTHNPLSSEINIICLHFA